MTTNMFPSKECPLKNKLPYNSNKYTKKGMSFSENLSFKEKRSTLILEKFSRI